MKDHLLESMRFDQMDEGWRGLTMERNCVILIVVTLELPVLFNRLCDVGFTKKLYTL